MPRRRHEWRGTARTPTKPRGTQVSDTKDLWGCLEGEDFEGPTDINLSVQGDFRLFLYPLFLSKGLEVKERSVRDPTSHTYLSFLLGSSLTEFPRQLETPNISRVCPWGVPYFSPLETYFDVDVRVNVPPFLFHQA